MHLQDKLIAIPAQFDRFIDDANGRIDIDLFEQEADVFRQHANTAV